ncbi:MAG: hypothetical protein ACRENB_16280 [Gemmatimonadales bacterium]
MKAKLVLLGLLVAVVSAGAAVAVFRARGALLPGEAPASRPTAFSLDRPDADSIALAAQVRTRCRLLWGKGRRACYEDILLRLAQAGRTRLAMGTLGRLSPERLVRRSGHELSHVIGINAWVPGKEVGAVYAQCTELFQSGCYHGVIQAYFAWSGTDSATVAALCDSATAIRESVWLRFQCVHGIGHGLVQTMALDLPRALDGCDDLSGPFDRESCYGGAFMEFVSGGRGQSHHPRAGPQATHERHEAEASTTPAFALRRREDPLYPCTVVEERYRRACYQLQPAIIFETAEGDMRRVARACDQAPERHRRSCYQGIGTYASGMTARHAGKTIRICSMGSPQYREWCFVGVAKNFVDVTSRADDGLDFCRRLEAPDIATRCHVAVGEQIALLVLFTRDREAACAKAPPAFVPACRYGAGLSRERPPGLSSS